VNVHNNQISLDVHKWWTSKHEPSEPPSESECTSDEEGVFVFEEPANREVMRKFYGKRKVKCPIDQEQLDIILSGDVPQAIKESENESDCTN